MYIHLVNYYYIHSSYPLIPKVFEIISIPFKNNSFLLFFWDHIPLDFYYTSLSSVFLRILFFPSIKTMLLVDPLFSLLYIPPLAKSIQSHSFNYHPYVVEVTRSTVVNLLWVMFLWNSLPLLINKWHPGKLSLSSISY